MDESGADAVADRGCREVGGRDLRKASRESAGSPRDVRRNAMDLNLTGTEVHALREALETVIFEMERKIAGLADPETRKELGRSRDALRSIKDKLPAGLIEVA
jgi:hypothetical protein